MIDTITYGLTKDSPSGPIIRPDETWLYGFPAEPLQIDDNQPLPRVQTVTSYIASALFFGVLGYLFLAL